MIGEWSRAGDRRGVPDRPRSPNAPGRLFQRCHSRHGPSGTSAGTAESRPSCDSRRRAENGAPPTAVRVGPSRPPGPSHPPGLGVAGEANGSGGACDRPLRQRRLYPAAVRSLAPVPPRKPRLRPTVERFRPHALSLPERAPGCRLLGRNSARPMRRVRRSGRCATRRGWFGQAHDDAGAGRGRPPERRMPPSTDRSSPVTKSAPSISQRIAPATSPGVATRPRGALSPKRRARAA